MAKLLHIRHYRQWLSRILQHPNDTPSRPADLWAYQAAATALSHNGYISLSDLDDHTDPCPGPGAMIPRIPRPDEVLEQRTLLDGLSDEARFVARLVLNTPAEALDYLTTPTRQQFTKSRISRYLRHRLGWDTHTVHNTLAELTAFVDEL